MPERKPRILHITRGTGKAGIERKIIALTRALEGDFDFGHLGLFLSASVDEAFAKMGLPTYCARIREKPLLRYPVYWHSIGRVRSIIEAFRADIVHLYHPPHHWWVGKAAKRTGAMVVLEACNANIYRKTKLAAFVERRGMRYVDAAIAISNYVVEEYENRFGVDKNRFTVIYNGTDTDAFYPAGSSEKNEIREKLGIPENSLVVGAAGRFVARKGFDLLLKALERISNELPNPVLLLIGDGPERGNLEEIASELPAETLFPGFRKDIAALLRAMDIYVCPSLHEEFGQALTEGMATGLPCIASRTGGFVEIGLDNDDCVFFEPGDIGSLSAAILNLAKDRELRLSLGHKARRRIENAFSLDSMITSKAGLYERLLNK